MTTGGLLVIVVTLGFTLAGWLLAMFTRHQLKVHIAARDHAVTPASPRKSESTVAVDLDLNNPLVSETRVYPSMIVPTGRVVVGTVKGRRTTIVHEG